jgi:hypothetical protein
MERFVSELEERLEAGLLETGLEKNAVLRHGQAIALIQQVIEELKAHIQSNPFPGMTEEIAYFKELAPRIYGRLFFHMKIYQVESLRQYASPGRFREALDQEMAEVEKFFTKHDDICQAYYQQTRYWDQQLFTRRGRENWPVDDISIIMDADFCLGAYWVSWIKANEKYRDWLVRAMAALRTQLSWEDLQKQAPNLEWKGSHTDLVELINGMHLAGSFGEASLKQVIQWFEANLGIDLGQFYITWQEIARRKKSRTKYVDLMKERLVGKMEGME